MNEEEWGQVVRARYLTSSTPAPVEGDAPVVTLTGAQLVALVRSAVNAALDERDERDGTGRRARAAGKGAR